MNTETLRRDLEAILKEEATAKQVVAFCIEVVEAIDSGEVPLHDGAMLMASFIGHPLWASDPGFAEITSIAAELEIPETSVASVPHPQAKYGELKDLLAKYAKTLA